MRSFYMKNGMGSEFRFGTSTHALIGGVGGLGFEKDLSFADYGEVWSKTEEKLPTTEIKLDLYFLDGYAGYRRFVSFAEEGGPFTLFYRSDETKYCFCEPKSLTKGELTAGAVVSSLTLTRLSHWYKDVTKEITFDVSATGKIYGFKYPFTYSSAYKGRIALSNSGYCDAPLRIVMSGDLDNPEINLWKGEEKLSSLRIKYASKSCVITVDAFPTRQAITISESGGEPFDGYEYQDFERENFLFLGKGAYTLEFLPHGTAQPSCSVTLTEGYLGN